MAPSEPSSGVPPVSARDHVQGSSTALVTLIEYADYECPDCGLAFAVVKALQKRFGDKLRFVFRHFPLDEHFNAESAAQAAEAAGAQGKFWEMHDELFKNQLELEPDNLAVYAKRLKLDVKRVESELERAVHRPRVRADVETGARAGMNGTPAFFINGVRFDGEPTEAGLAAALNAAMPGN